MHAARINAINWDTWTPVDRATLLFVISDGQILLIRKKRGLGAGKINGPGGRVEGEESHKACAEREFEEELCAEATGTERAGRLRFQFWDGYSLECHVFRAEGVIGEPCETEEAIPIWTPITDIPYHEMWADDVHWLPLMLKGQAFDGCFIFDGERMVDHLVTTS